MIDGTQAPVTRVYEASREKSMLEDTPGRLSSLRTSGTARRKETQVICSRRERSRWVSMATQTQTTEKIDSLRQWSNAILRCASTGCFGGGQRARWDRTRKSIGRRIVKDTGGVFMTVCRPFLLAIQRPSSRKGLFQPQQINRRGESYGAHATAQTSSRY